ncbi:MAG TPA: diacylglycerol kinase family protein [Flavitalea sp.]|nr:diacylglycerol kinase family protein [Flavitalea sp.]
MKCLFIVNPGSGAGQKDWEQIIKDFFAGRSEQIQFYQLEKDADNKEEIKKMIRSYQPDRVITAGGDGTIKMTAEALLEFNIPLGIIPAGSANGMAKELNIPLNPEAALQLSISAQSKPLDLISINNEYCIHLSDIGLNASMLERFEENERRGFLGYIEALMKMMGRHQFMRVTIYANNRIYKRKVVMAVIANASKYGTGAIINPAGDPSDGEFEVVLVRRLGLFALLRMIITRKPLNENRVEIIKCKQMRLTVTRPYPFQIDGEYRDKLKEINAVIEPGVIQVISS